MNDPRRIVSREIALKKIFLDQYGDSCELHCCGALWSADEWAAAKWFGNKSDLAAGMLKATTEPIHRSLHKLEARKDLAKEGARHFKNLLGYCGLRKSSAPEALAEEWLRAGIDHPELRAELFAQLMKQLTESEGQLPRTSSAFSHDDKAWNLLVASLSHFAPPKAFENFLAQFIRSRAPQHLRDKLEMLFHTSVFYADRSGQRRVASRVEASYSFYTSTRVKRSRRKVMHVC